MYFDDGVNDEYSSMKNQRRNNMAKKKKHNPFKHGNNNPKSKPLANVYHDTKQHFLSMKSLKVPESILYDIDELQIDFDDIPIYDTICVVQNKDTLDMAMEFRNMGLNPLVLNMASDYRPGGGVKSGKMAQEECLFRRTNAFMTHPEEWYPLGSNNIIYSPEVHIIKDHNYQMLNEANETAISMIAVAAIRKPKLVNGIYHDDDRHLMTSKIEAIFKIALLHGHDSLILGALGCGAFHNPPKEVVEIFRIMVNQYGKYFKQIGFAILCVKDSDNDNLEAFRKKF
jgi:uncharacterized protein (TIGR02452 family)